MFLKIVSPKGKYKDNDVYDMIVRYVLSPYKVHNANYCHGYNLNLDTAAEDMIITVARFNKNRGTRIRHMILIFDPHSESHISGRDVNDIAFKVCCYYARNGFQLFHAVHEDKKYLHAHIIMNTVRITNGKKYEGDKADYHRFQNHLKMVLRPYGLKLDDVLYGSDVETDY